MLSTMPTLALADVDSENVAALMKVSGSEIS
jgi:hypothetical protein